MNAWMLASLAVQRRRSWVEWFVTCNSLAFFLVHNSVGNLANAIDFHLDQIIPLDSNFWISSKAHTRRSAGEDQRA